MKKMVKMRFLSVRSLKKEMAIAIGLILMCLLVFVGYLFPGVSSFFESRQNLHLSVVVVIVLFIILIAFAILSQIINSVIHLSREAKKIADGDFNHSIEFIRDDELGQLGEAINRMTLRMKENVDELQRFSQTTEQINAEINRRIVTLSNLLQISNLIAQNAQFKEIVEVAVGKCLASGALSLGSLLLKDYDTSEFKFEYLCGSRAEELTAKGIPDLRVRLGEGFLGKALLRQTPSIIDRETVRTSEMEVFLNTFGIFNALVAPVISKGNVYGLLITANETKDFSFPKTEIELIQVVARQIAIAQSNEILQKEITRLEVKDKLTGLFNQGYLRNRLTEEIKRAVSFQRPCSLMVITIDQFENFRSALGNIAAENVLIKIGAILKESVAETDRPARSGDYEFAIIFPEKNKRQSIVVADAIRRKMEMAFAEEKEPVRRLTCTGAVTENPIDGVTADELIEKARSILEEAKSQGNNRICYKV